VLGLEPVKDPDGTIAFSSRNSRCGSVIQVRALMFDACQKIPFSLREISKGFVGTGRIANLRADGLLKMRRIAGCSTLVDLAQKNSGFASRSRRQSELLESMTGSVLDCVGLCAGMSCLDLGCGPGEVMRLMAERVGRPAGLWALMSMVSWAGRRSPF
jgi:hypothetical protein